ncbi:MAG: guanylate kinase, partial [Candidatus Hydrothermae bacterium]|nr:guanylate kinase [Candidatus Hydrothermae bacterium]
INRGVESGKLEVRIQNAIREIEGAPEYDYWIVNDDLQEAVDALAAIVQAERQRSRRFHRFPLSLPAEVGS